MQSQPNAPWIGARVCGRLSADLWGEELDPDRYRLAGKVQTAAGARTALFVPELSRLFVAAPRRDEHAAEIMVYQVGP